MIHSRQISVSKGKDDSSILTQPAPRRLRPGIKRVPTGCVTCRKRRKKCDEATPACAQCMRLGLLCEGYTTQRLWTPLLKKSRKGVSKQMKVSVDAQTEYAALLSAVPYQYDEYFTDLAFSLFRSDSPFYLSRASLAALWNNSSVQRPPKLSYYHGTCPRVFEFYIVEVANRLSLVSGTANPFVHVILPMALSSPALLHTLAALGALELQGKLPYSTNEDFMFHYTRATGLLASALGTDQYTTDDSVLATILFVSLFLTSESNDEISISPLRHITAATKIVLARGGPRAMTTPTQRFLLELFAYGEMKYSAPEGQLALCVANDFNPDPVLPIMGASPAVIQILGELHYLNGNFTGDFDVTLDRIVRGLEELKTPTNAGHGDREEIAALTDAMHWSVRLSFQKLLDLQGPSKVSSSGDKVGRIMDAIHRVPTSSPLASGLLWPWILYVVGSHLEPGSQEARDVLDRLDFQICNCEEGRQIRQLLGVVQNSQMRNLRMV